MDGPQALFVATPPGVEHLLADELLALGALKIRQGSAGVQCEASLETAYRICLWSRLANRVLLPIQSFAAATPEALYDGIHRLRWEDQLRETSSLAVSFNTSGSAITHSRYGMQKVKDAIVDRFREKTGQRPSIDRERPDLRVNVYLYRNRARVSIDLSGRSLHQRGYRAAGAEAPLKENLAAALLVQARWPEAAAAGHAFLDPMCGTGTLCVEAAWMAADIAPGLLADYFGFQGWLGHAKPLWQGLQDEARQRRDRGLEQLPPILGRDIDPRALEQAREQARRAGLEGRIEFQQGAVRDFRSSHARGCLVVNPPYGVRLGQSSQLKSVYRDLNDLISFGIPGWEASVFSADRELLQEVRLKPVRNKRLRNGALDCVLQTFQCPLQGGQELPVQGGSELSGEALYSVSGAESFANRLKKNYRHWSRWARRQDIACYRVYDRDLPDFAVAIDIYQGSEKMVHVQEYAAPASIDGETARRRVQAVIGLVPQILDTDAEQVFFKQRRRQRGQDQYGRLDRSRMQRVAEEGGLRFQVNLRDYLDTGLFLDHRLTRALIGSLAKDRDFLNLYAYTGTATVYAAAHGASSTTSVDLSRTYLDWADKNLRLNRLEHGKHALVQADCLQWLRALEPGQRYGLIFIDPPTFSNSKRLDNDFDIQRDHSELLKRALSHLEAGGDLVFSTNRRGFRLDTDALGNCQVEDVSASTIPEDFRRNPTIHRCWRIRHGA